MESSTDRLERGPERPASPAPAARKFRIGRFAPLAVLALGFALFFAFGLEHQLSLEALRANRRMIEGWVAAHPFVAALVFVAVYALIVALSVPVGALMTISGGFLFGTWEGGGLVVVAATIGATVIFLATRTALAGPIRSRVGPRIAAMEDGLHAHAFNYLLVLRLVPLFPFFLVNLGAGLLGVGLRPYVLATAIGTVPGTLVYTGLGNGLGKVFDAGGSPDLGLIFRPAIFLPLIGLALLSLLPVLWRALRGAHAND